MFQSRFLLCANAIFLLCAIGGCTTAPTSNIDSLKPRFTRQVDSILNGQWEGSLKKREPLTSPDLTKSPDADDLKLRVMLDGWNAKVFLFDDGEWREVMPNSFKVTRYSTNAIAIAIDSSGSEKGGWVESWAILMTVKNDDEILAEWTRVVNNLSIAAPNVAQTFSMGAVGTLHRMVL